MGNGEPVCGLVSRTKAFTAAGEALEAWPCRMGGCGNTQRQGAWLGPGPVSL